MILSIIFSWLVIMIAVNIYRGIQEKSNKGGECRKQKHFNGKWDW